MTVNSINTNAAALQGLASLDAASQQVTTAQNQISTGLKVASAKDDGATWSIAQHMRSQAADWQVVSDSLNRGQSILDVAASGAAEIGDLLKKLQAKALSYSDTSLDATSRSALQTDMTALIQQIDRTANNADFNGVNLLNVSSGYLGVEVTSAQQAGPTQTIHYQGQIYGLGAWAPQPGQLTSATYTPDSAPSTSVDLNPPPMYPSGNGDYHEDWNLSTTLGPGTFNFTFSSPHGSWFGFDVQGNTGGPPAKIISDPSGGSIQLSQWDMRSAALGLGSLDWSDPQSIIAAVNDAVSTVTNASMTIGTQQNSLTTSLKTASTAQTDLQTGVSNLVDADMGQESAKLQAAQTKQQLAAKSLAIANVTPQWILSLFR
jgi:flagellin